MNPFDFDGLRRIAERETGNQVREAARRAAKTREENRRFAWAWAPEPVQLAAGFDPYSPKPVLPLGWPPGTDPSMDVTVLKEPPALSPATGSISNPWT